MIELDRVSKRYGSKPILHDISFDVKPGEIVGFLGPNGAGKTTTMRLIAGYTAATAGTVRVAGYDMATSNHEAAAKIGYLPEQPPLYDVMDVSAYLNFVAKAKGLHGTRARSELDRVLTACRLEDVANKDIYKLSKGYRQRVGLAQALLGDPDVLLLDEPTAGLDPGQIQETREVIRDAGTRHAVLLSSHILPEVTLLCHRVAIINQGRLLATGSPQDLQRAADQTSAVALETGGDPDALKQALLATDGVAGVQLQAIGARPGIFAIDCQVSAEEGVETRIARAVTQSGELYRLERRQPTLEDVFLNYIGHQGGRA
jgi:ABC-2 type transport system ATP-binding protein